MRPIVRRVRPDDSLEALTELLHRAYAPLAAQGLRYVATHQSVDVTRKRLSGGEGWVLDRDGQVVGTVLLYPPPGDETRGAAWYARPDVAKFGQLAVDPAFKGRGYGAVLLDHVERRARELGAAEIACDTAEGATALVAMYGRRGYRIVQEVDWRPHTNYLSVLLSLRLAPVERP